MWYVLLFTTVICWLALMLWLRRLEKRRGLENLKRKQKEEERMKQRPDENYPDYLYRTGQLARSSAGMEEYRHILRKRREKQKSCD